MAISASCITACAICRLFLGKLEMEVVLNATLAGGVSVGSSSDLVVTAGTAMAIGGLAGILSAVGFLKLSKFLQEKINLHDTCGVHNLHGLPGVLGGVLGAVSASLADSAFDNKQALEETFEKIAEGRTTSEQGWIQLAALGITLGLSIGGGAIGGFIASRFGKIEHLFDDEEHFEEPGYIEEVEEKQMEMQPVPPDSARGQTEAK